MQAQPAFRQLPLSRVDGAGNLEVKISKRMGPSASLRDRGVCQISLLSTKKSRAVSSQYRQEIDGSIGHGLICNETQRICFTLRENWQSSCTHLWKNNSRIALDSSAGARFHLLLVVGYVANFGSVLERVLPLWAGLWLKLMVYLSFEILRAQTN